MCQLSIVSMTCVITATMLSLFIGMLFEKTLATPMDSVMVDMAAACLSKCGDDHGRDDVKSAQAQRQLLSEWRCVGPTLPPLPPLSPITPHHPTMWLVHLQGRH